MNNLHESLGTLHTPAEVADYLGSTTGGLAQMRYRGTGPKFVKLGPKKVRYRDSDIKEWLEENVKADTAE